MITREEESLEANGRHFRYTSYELLLLIDLFLWNSIINSYIITTPWMICLLLNLSVI